ncbi:helix-turn-helix domain-containing protein [Streptomyces sp. B6B3]|uniref:helix-turn-helix domain-containing protein n=1 Tax=Streptomyces sp. B6B3 TaxID=3153570 RepID=UPI00325C7F32
MYRERPSRIGGAAVWSNALDVGGDAGRVLPDGCMDVMWWEGPGRRELVVAGPDTRALMVPRVDGARCVGLRFPPGTGPAFFGLPACELTDQRVPLAAVWSASEVAGPAERIADGADPGTVLEELAVRRLRGAPRPELLPAGQSAPGGTPWPAAVVAAADAGLDVARMAWELGLSERQLRRRSRAAFGYGPKTLVRVLRMRRALRLARGGVRLAEVAARSGYADQAHLSREVRDLAGAPISALVRRAGAR